MSTKGKIGFGISLANSSTLGGSYTAIAEILEITPPERQAEAIKVQRSDNATAVTEKVPGWEDVQAVEATIVYSPTQRATLEGLFNTPSFWKIVYPMVGSQTVGGDADGFAGFLTMLGKETPIKDLMKCKIKIEVNGAVTYTAGS